MSYYPLSLCEYIIDKYFPPNIKKPKLLDVGCGYLGRHTASFRVLGLESFGVDKNCFYVENPYYKYCDLEKDKIPFKDNYFDFVFSKSVIEHIYNTENFMKEIYRVLKPYGRVVILTPDYESRYKDFFEHWQHVKPFTLKSLWSCMEEFGLKNVKVEKFYQLPFTWKYPFLKFIPKLISLLPDSFKWKDKKQTKHRTLIRFSKEKLLIGYGEK